MIKDMQHDTTRSCELPSKVVWYPQSERGEERYRVRQFRVGRGGGTHHHKQRDEFEVEHDDGSTCKQKNEMYMDV